MSSVTFSTGVGGDGSTVTDDNDATTGLREGGWKTRFVPCFTQQVAVANYVVSAATSALGGATTNSTSATSLVIGTGSKSLTLGQTGKAYIIGQYVIIASTASPSNYMIGQVTSFSGTTLVVNVTTIKGSGTIAAWSISVTGGQTATNLAAGSAGTIPYQSAAGTTQMLAAGTSGQVLTSAGAAAPTWQTSNSGSFGTDLSYVDYSLTVSSAISATAGSAIRMQSVSLDGTSELLIIGGSSSAHAVIFNTSTQTFGTPVLVRTGDLQQAQTIGLAKISSTAVLVCSLVASGTALETVVLTVSGSAITVGTALATTLAANSSLIMPNTRLVTVGSSYVLNYYNATGTTPKFRAITVSGSTPSIGSELAYTGGGTLALMHHSYAQSATILLHFSMTASTTVFALPITVSGTTLTAGTAATVATTGPSFFVTGALSSSRYALYYLNTTGRGAVVSVAGSVASISTAATTIAIVATGPAMQVFSNQAFILPGGGAGEFINVLTDTAGVATLGTALATPGSPGSFVGYLSTGKVFYSSATGNSAYHQYGISSGSPVLEKSFSTVTTSSPVTAAVLGDAEYTRPLSGPPQSGSGNSVVLRTAAGKIAVGSASTSPFVVSIDGTNPGKLQQSANPFTAFNDGISDAVAWGIPTAIAASTTTIQLRKVTLI